MGGDESITCVKVELAGLGYHVTEDREAHQGNRRVVALRQSYPSLQATRIEVSTLTRSVAWEAVLGAARAIES